MTKQNLQGSRNDVTASKEVVPMPVGLTKKSTFLVYFYVMNSAQYCLYCVVCHNFIFVPHWYYNKQKLLHFHCGSLLFLLCMVDVMCPAHVILSHFVSLPQCHKRSIKSMYHCISVPLFHLLLRFAVALVTSSISTCSVATTSIGDICWKRIIIVVITIFFSKII